MQVDDDKSNVSGIKVTSNRSARQYMWVCTARNNMAAFICFKHGGAGRCAYETLCCSFVVPRRPFSCKLSFTIGVAYPRLLLHFRNRRGGFNRPLPTEKTGEKVARD